MRPRSPASPRARVLYALAVQWAYHYAQAKKAGREAWAELRVMPVRDSGR